MTNTRELALKILLSIEEDKVFSNIALNKMIPEEMDKRDVNFIRELVYGVVENKLYIDSIIRKASSIRIKKIHPSIMEILRMGIYQIVFMDKVPNSAAVNESVKLAKKRGNKGSIGFVNGVLRSISRSPNKYISLDEKDPVEYLAIKYSHPRYIVEEWLDKYGYDFTKDLLENNNKTPSLNIRVNSLKTNRDELRKKLEKKCLICAEGVLSKDALVIENPHNIIELEEFKDGLFTIQDESSMLVGQVLNPREGSLVLDMCSAPGGKATHLAQLMNNKGKVIARDIHDHKISLIEENVKRLGTDIVTAELYDALELDEGLRGKVDYCLIDAPCSGLGLIRRKPEIKWNRMKSHIDELMELQYKILSVGKNYIKDGGVLLYSTCTIFHGENLSMVEKFLKENKEFSLTPIREIDEKFDTFKTLNKGYIQLFPHIHGTDGFFIAKMIKEG